MAGFVLAPVPRGGEWAGPYAAVQFFGFFFRIKVVRCVVSVHQGVALLNEPPVEIQVVEVTRRL